MKNQSAANPAAVFEEHLGQLTALVRQRLTLELQFHQRHDLEQLESDLTELVVEFGQLLRVIYRYDLGDALTHEAAWFASVLAARGPGLDAWRLLLDSWVMAIEGVIKPPECNQLAAPLMPSKTLSLDGAPARVYGLVEPHSNWRPVRRPRN
ncbi:MAG: hypothetical protein ACP5MD_07265 [Verrucomicrobiia bacterium]